jgi:hypothetical protein
MRALLVAIIALAACEQRKPHEPPPPPKPPADARVDDYPHVDEDKRATLDRLYEYITTTKRERSELEAPAELTGAYVDLLFAYGYARLGVASRSRELRVRATQTLATSAGDPVHGTLIEIFEARIASALADKATTEPLPAGVEAQLAMLDRAARYKVDRLREQSRVLAAGIAIDAIGAFAHRRADSRGEAFTRLAGAPDPTTRATILGEILDGARDTKADERGLLIAAVLGEAVRVPKEPAMKLVARARELVDELPAANRARVYAKAIVVMHKFDRAPLAELAKTAAPSFAVAPRYELAPALWDCVRTLGISHKPELREVWKHVEKIALAKHDMNPEMHDASAAVVVAFAAGLVQLGDPRGKQILDDLAANGPGHQTMWMDVQRGLPPAYAYLPKQEALAAIERVARNFPRVTDSFGTNSHFSLYVLAFVDALVVGVVDE